MDYRNRIYSSQLGRFLQIDPIRFDAGDSNLYRYAFGSPMVLIDPLGLKTEACCWEAYGNMLDAATMEFMAEGGSVANGFTLGTVGNAASGGLAAWSGNPWLMGAAALNEIIQGGVSSYAIGVEMEMYHTRVRIAEEILEDCLQEVQ